MQLGILAPNGLPVNSPATIILLTINRAICPLCALLALLPATIANLSSGKAGQRAGMVSTRTAHAVQVMLMQMACPGTAAAGVGSTISIPANATSLRLFAMQTRLCACQEDPHLIFSC